MIFQCEPDAFDDEYLMEAQRSTPMVILHGKKDNVVRSSSGEYAYSRLLSHGFHNVKFLNPSLGHPYDFLPVNEAIEYLDALTTNDSKLLHSYTAKMRDEQDWRTTGFALKRARELGEDKSFKEIRVAFEAQASKLSARHLKDIKKGVYGKWVDRFLRWQEDFALAESSVEVMAAWESLSEEHSDNAKSLATDAKKAFKEGKSDQGWEKRKEIVLDNFASPQYRTLKKGVEKKFGKLYKLTKKRR